MLTHMKWVVAMLLTFVGSWMTFDGARALIVGDYLTPSSGEYAGTLGPWSQLVERIGIRARSTAMMTAFIVIGFVHLAAATLLVLNTGEAPRWFALVASLMGLWYLPSGTVADGIALAIILLSSLRPW
jgi:hypothetical protein